MAEKDDVTLYYFPASYYSLKVILALYEKEVTFKKKLICIIVGEQNEDWYLKVNKRGLVPVLEIGGQYVTESEDIIDVIDQTFSSDPRLIPDVKTVLGNEVKDFRKFLHDIPVDIITYGVLSNRELCVDRSTVDKLPSMMDRDRTDKRFSGEVAHLKKIRETCSTERKEAIDEKIIKVSNKIASALNEEIVRKRLDELEDVFDRIEHNLEKVKGEKHDSEDTWLFGPTFTAADITAIILMFRLNFIGVAPRYFSSTTRPIVHEYYTRAKERPSVMKTFDIFGQAQDVIRKVMLKKYGLKAIKIGLVVGALSILGYIGLKQLFKGAKTSPST